MELRTYQMKALTASVNDWAKGYRKLLLVLATGTGKTVIFLHEARRTIEAGKRVLILAHRDELVRQPAERAKEIMPNISVAVEKGEEWADESGIYGKAQLVVSSIQTQNSGEGNRKRMLRFDPADFGLVIVDEAHHSTADTYRAVIDHYLTNPECRLLGVTATPDRNDDKDLGKLYESLPYRYDLPDAITDGYLVPLCQRSVVITGLDFSKVKTKKTPEGGRDFVESELEAVMIAEKPVQQVASAAIELACGLEKGALRGLLDLDEESRRTKLRDAVAGRPIRRALVFCVSVAHARLMSDVLNRWLGNETADSVDGETDADSRRQKFIAFRTGERPFLCNCMIATEGTDLPEAEVIVVARPTKSRALFCQIVGRGTRPLPALAYTLGGLPDAESRRSAISASAKPFCLVLDFTDNSKRHDLVTAVDLISSPDDDAAVVDAAKEIADEKDVTPEEALAEAAELVELERAVAGMEAEVEQAAQDAETALGYEAWRRSLVAAADYDVSDGDGYGGHVGGASAKAVRGGATDKQVDFLVKLGVRRDTAEGFGKQQAGAVITKLKSERCTVGQAKWLRGLGYSEAEIGGMNFDAACAAIDLSKQEGART